MSFVNVSVTTFDMGASITVGGGLFIYLSKDNLPVEYDPPQPQQPLTVCSSLGRGGTLLA